MSFQPETHEEILGILYERYVQHYNGRGVRKRAAWRKQCEQARVEAIATKVRW